MLSSKQYIQMLNAKLKRFSTSQSEWKQFLITSGRMYKYSFTDSVSIYTQKPNATACAEITTWKKATNRRVVRTSEAIGLVVSPDNANVTKIRYVFDISNTEKVNEQSKTPYFWKITEQSEARVYNELKSAYSISGVVNLEEAVQKIVKERIAYLTNNLKSNIIQSTEGSAAADLDEYALTAICERFAYESATYAILSRCGKEYDADFSDLYNFNTINSIVAVGGIINQVSEEVLRGIEKTMKTILKEEYYERIRETAQNENESDRGRGDNIHPGRENGDIPSVLGRTGGDSRYRQVRQNEAEISQGAPADNIRTVAIGGRADETSSDGERTVRGENTELREQEHREIRSDGRAAEQQSIGMGENLQHPAQDGGGTGAQRDSLRITEQETAVSSENDTVVFLSEENELTEKLTGEEIQTILRYDRFLKHSKSEIAGFFLSDSDETSRAEYLKSAYDEAYTELIVGDERYGYHNEINGLELWKGSTYLSKTADIHISWECAADIVDDMIKSHEYLSAGELDKQAEYVDIEPQKEENGEQLSFFDMEMPEATSGAILPVEAISDVHFDNTLRLGNINDYHSRQNIIAYYKKPDHTIEDKAEFLKEQYLSLNYRENIHDTAFGIKSLDNKLSAYCSESGITLKAGETVFSVGGKSKTITWQEAAERIQAMLDNGTYAPQAVLDSTREIEANEVADRAWEIWRNQSEDANIKLDIDDSFFTHTSETIELIAEKMLNDRQWLENTAKSFAVYADRWTEDRSIQRFNGYIYNPVTVAEELNSFTLEEIEYTAQEDVPFPAEPYVNLDHVEMFFRKRDHISGARERIHQYFTTHIDTKAQATFIKEIYGNGGECGGEFNYSGFGSKGAEFEITVDRIPADKRTISWTECAKIISHSIKLGRYNAPVLFTTEKADSVQSEPKSEWRMYVIPDLKTWADNGKTAPQTPIEYFNTFDEAKERFDVLRNQAYNSEKATINGLPAARLTLGIDCNSKKRALDILHVRDNQNVLVDDFTRYESVLNDKEAMALILQTSEEIGFNSVMSFQKLENGKLADMPEFIPFEKWDNPVLSKKQINDAVINVQPFSDEADVVYSAYIGKEFTYEGREYKVDTVNGNSARVLDMTMLKSARYPIFRSMPVSEVVQAIDIGQPAEKEKIEAIDYSMTASDYTNLGGEKSRFKTNIEAIKLLHKIEAEGRNATAEEQTVLAKYVGWGGLSAAFNADNKAWSNEYKELSETLTPTEYSAARESTMTAFYTEPQIIAAVYEGLKNIGFKGGNILDPSMGTGNFFGAMPGSIRDNSRLYGVELDSISARIAKQLYQSADITEGAYEKRVLRDNFYDAAISNVPFGQFKVHDKRYDSLNLNIHDYFFAKSIDKVRPGGIIAFITTSGTLDKSSSKFRTYMAERAELLGAVRLPNTAFKAVAGTEVTSDIIFLQKRDKILSVNKDNCDWLEISTDSKGIPMNNYFALHPEMIIGEMKQGVEYSMYGDPDATACVAPEGYDIYGHLRNAVMSIEGEYTPYTAQEEVTSAESKAETIPADEQVDNYSYAIYNGSVYYRENSIMTKVEKNADRIAALIDLKVITRRLFQLQLENAEQAVIDDMRGQLNDSYDAFIKKYGYINSKANEAAYSTDSSYYLLKSLEKFDKTDNTYLGKADVFIKNTIRPTNTVVSVSTAVEAIGVSLCEKGCIDISYMSQLCGLSEEQTAKDCIDAGAIYKLPPFPPRAEQTDIYVTADEYLSGNIREKLTFAKTAALTDKSYEHNIEALEKVMPAALTASEIDVRIGVNWIDMSDYDRFIYDIFDARGGWRQSIHTRYSDVTGEFNVSNKNAERTNIKVYNEYGTSRMNALEIFENTLNQRPIKVYDRIEQDGKIKSVINSKETEKAQEKQELIKEAFANWIYRDPERRQRIVERYNELFNSIRPRTYDGSHLVLHGASEKYKLFDHQRNALARTLYGKNTLLAHVVGAGKTFEMVASAMEAKYIGVCHKSLICVPNHIVGQFASDFMELYPGANILVATEKDFEMKNRKLLCSKIATGDYDAVIIGHSQLLKIPLSMERQKNYIRTDIEQIVEAIDNLDTRWDEGNKYSVKQLEKMKKSLEARLEKLTDNETDDVVTFEELGVDRIYVDEAHMFKNLYVVTKMSNVAGLQQTEAKKSADLYYKCKYLDEITDGKGVVFATGTPVSNSMTELYTMMRYLQADTLQKLHLQHFDAWAANYADITNTMELAPEGNTYRMRTRFAKFHNLPELMNIFKECADIKTADDLVLNVPEAVFENIAAEPTEEQKELMKGLSERASKIHDKQVDPTEDNMLKVTSDGRKIGLDQRLMNPLLPDVPGTKVNLCVDRVFDIWQSTAEKRLTQLIFCDFSTPRNDGTFNLYDDVKSKLLDKGVPENEIAFIHDYNTDAKKQTLFAKVRKGDVRILLGSTAKCGAGTNVQEKLIALHHLDCPWRPADLEQREGRIIRQGNTNSKVYVYRYVTKDTFDAYLYQIIENKQKGISQIMTSKTPVRNCEDVDEAVLNYSEVKALCTGNPLIKERMELDIDIAKLKRLQSAFMSEKYNLEDRLIKYYPQRKADAEKYIKNTAIDAESYKPYGEEFTEIMINGKVYTDKKEASEQLLKAIRTVGSTDLPKIGTYKGFDMKVSFEKLTGAYYVTMIGKARYVWEVGQDKFGNMTRLENTLKSISNVHEKAKHDLTVIERDIASAEEFVKTPWAKETELSEKSARLREVDRLIAAAEHNTAVTEGAEQNEDEEPEM